MNIPILTDKEFRLISNLVYQKFGINLTDKKRSLVIERLQKTLRQGEFSSFKAYYDYVVSDQTGKALLHLVDKVSTNHTYFFRESEHYSFLKTVMLPQICSKAKEKKLRIWSAGCSSGEEAYTTAIILKEFFREQISNWDVAILATDISTSVLEKAIAGVYAENSMLYVPDDIRRRYFKKTPSGLWEINREIKSLVTFKRLNLMNATFPFKGKFEVIFCRNVMIYFDNITREQLIQRFSNYIQPEGYFFIGHSESLYRDNPFFKFIKPAIYQKR